jgi:DNA-binding CsgD family transcriptional regulator
VTVLLWSARFAMIRVEAAVEQALDAVASRETIDLPAIVANLYRRVDVVRAELASRPTPPALDPAAQLAQATASLTRLVEPDPDAWAEAARCWSELGDPWWTAVARLREADASASTGAMDRGAAALREAYRLASEMGAAPLLAQVSAVSRRTRLSVDVPARVALDAMSVQRLGLTPRESEVLALVASGRSNRQIGEELFVSEKTASVHVSNILRKLGVTSRVDAAAVAQRLGVA